ncbi:endonuclease III [Geopsychrobacter electrodiphilus]|uniref:endonuclease III n=1 Tax=Geopsychrobacter electrodiphilus TaxID=225196 RepID=UPI000368CAA3|nr:endonuclease III [Geopsychrobacter electrodiphilus]
MPTTREAESLLNRLEQIYPDASCALVYSSAWQLLVATILSAQCTDKRVNLVTEDLFRQLPTPASLAAAEVAEVEELVHSAGFYHSKARHLQGCAQAILDRHAGEVPNQLCELVKLPGVGRKTANVVLGNIFNVPGMVVDTHVRRLSRRFGWTGKSEPVQIEKDLCLLLPASRWTQCGHTLIEHGRVCCKAPVPYCSQCPVIDLCPRIGVGKSH